MPGRPLAQQALAAHDQYGAEISALMASENLSEETQPPQFDGTRVYILADDTVAQYHAGHAVFTWTEKTPSGQLTRVEQRPSAVHPDQLKGPNRKPAHLCHWPNEEDLYKLVVDLAYNDAAGRMDDQNTSRRNPNMENNLPEHLVYGAAPHLAPHVNDIITSFQMPDWILQMLDSELHECASNVLRQLPEHEYESIVNLALADLTKET